LVDSGTYSYHTQPLWRAYFRGTSAHNTLCVDHLDQSVSGGTFLWSAHADTRCLIFELGTAEERIIAEHDGYRRLDDPAVHRREIVYQRAPRTVSVTDHIHCAAAHTVEIFWHFSRDCRVTLDDDLARAERDGVGIELRWPAPLRARVVKGSVDPIGGWISQRFDDKVPADTLVVSGTISGDWQGVSTIKISLQGSA
jgi:hypothetical protein